MTKFWKHTRRSPSCNVHERKGESIGLLARNHYPDPRVAQQLKHATESLPATPIRLPHLHPTQSTHSRLFVPITSVMAVTIISSSWTDTRVGPMYVNSRHSSRSYGNFSSHTASRKNWHQMAARNSRPLPHSSSSETGELPTASRR